jgi:hypothetical protein
MHTIKCIESTLIIKYTLKASFSLSKNILKFKKNSSKGVPPAGFSQCLLAIGD